RAAQGARGDIAAQAATQRSRGAASGRRTIPLMPELNLVQAVNQGLAQAMETDDRVIVFGEDVGLNGGVFRATEGLFKKFGPERVIDTPLAELGIVGAAVGMAIYGLRPVCEIQFDGFLPTVMDQVMCHIGRIRNRHRG